MSYFKYYTANGKNMKKGQNGFKMMEFILKNNGATKYELVTNVLGKVGTKKELRGYYSCYMRGWVDSGLVELDTKTHKYYATAKGANYFLCAK